MFDCYLESQYYPDEVILYVFECFERLPAEFAAFGSDRIQLGPERTVRSFICCVPGTGQRGFIPAVYICDLRIQTFGLGAHLRKCCVPICLIDTCRLCDARIKGFGYVVACRCQIHLQCRLVINVHYHRPVRIEISHHHICIIRAPVIRLRMVMLSVPVRMLRSILSKPGNIDEMRYAARSVRHPVFKAEAVHRYAVVALRIHAVHRRLQKPRVFYKIFDYMREFRLTLYSKLILAVVKRRQLEVEHRDSPACPFRSRMVYHLPCACSPVELCPDLAPFLCCMCSEHYIILRSVSRSDHALRHRKHQANRTAVILKSVEIYVVMASYKDLLFRRSAFYLSDNIV